MAVIGNLTKYQDAPYFETVGNGVTTTYALSWVPGFPGSLIVVVGGVPQPVGAYTVNGTQLILSEAPKSGSRVLVFGRGQIATLQQPAAGSVSSSSFNTAGVALPLGSTNLPAVTGGFKNLKLSATGTNSLVTVSADELVLSSGSSYYVTRTVNLVSLNLAASGANGLDTGTSSTATWYSVWVIYNPSSDMVAGILSASETAPTLPSGFTYKARVGWVRSDSTANKFPLGFIQYGRKVQYTPAVGSNLTAVPIMASGLAGDVNNTWAAVPVSAFVPPTGKLIELMLRVGNSGAALCAPNTSYGGVNDTAKPSPMSLTVAANTYGGVQRGSMLLESSAVYWASSVTTNLLACVGWEDNI